MFWWQKIVKTRTKLNLKPNSSSAGGGGRVGVEATAALAAHLFGGKLNFLGSYFSQGIIWWYWRWRRVVFPHSGKVRPLPPPEVKEVHTGNDKVRRTGRQPSCILFHLCVVVYHSQRSICAFLSVYICAYTHKQTRPYTYFLPTPSHIRATGDDSEPLHPGPQELLFLQRVFGYRWKGNRPKHNIDSHIKILSYYH